MPISYMSYMSVLCRALQQVIDSKLITAIGPQPPANVCLTGASTAPATPGLTNDGLTPQVEKAREGRFACWRIPQQELLMHPAPQSSGISGLVTGLDTASHQPVPYISSLSIPSPGTRTPHTVDTVYLQSATPASSSTPGRIKSWSYFNTLSRLTRSFDTAQHSSLYLYSIYSVHSSHSNPL